jgi:hypothetical protein
LIPFYTFDTARRKTTIQRDTAGRVTTITYNALNYRKVQYDNLNRPTSQIDCFSNNSEMQKLTYTYDVVGNPSGILDGNGSLSTIIWDGTDYLGEL